MDSVNFRVDGLPVPKGSVTRMPNGKYLPAGTPASRMQFGLWKDNVSTAARVAMRGHSPWRGAVRIMAEFQLPVPTSVVKKYQWGWLPHVKRPDVDKLTRALFDPLKAIVWVDDSQVCHCTVNKVYAWDTQPGAIVIVDFLTDQWLEQYGVVHREIVNVMDSL